MITEKERKNRQELFKLMQENPDLPVVPMVDGKLVFDDFAYWKGSLGRAYIDEYVVADRAELVLFKSDDDVFGALEEYMSDEEFESLPESEEGCRSYYDKLPWTKAIFVYITTPDY